MEPDLVDLLAAWHGRETEPARREALLARLRLDEAFRRSFVAEIRMLGMLKTAQSPESRWLRLEDELGWSTSERAPAEPLEDRVIRRLDDLPRWRLRPSRSAAGRASLAAAVLLLGAWLAWRPRSGPEAGPSGPPSTSTATARPYPAVDTSTGLAMVVKLGGVRWGSTDEPRPSEGDVLAAGRFRFASGRVLLSMLTGVVLDIEGPADVDLVSDARVVCHRGRIRARVPAGAEGFVIRGPSSVVVDLGTEFGLNVGLDGKMQGRVFKGKLEAALLDTDGSPRRSYLLDATKPASSQAFEVDSRSGTIEAVATPGDFVSASSPIPPPLTLDPAYPAAILASRPWGYWRFGSLVDGSTPNEVSGRPPLVAHGPVRLAGPGSNLSAEFRPGSTPQFLSMDEDWRPTWHPGFAVEFWCLTESIGHASLVSLVSPKDTDHHVFLMELTSRDRLTIHKPAAVRLLHRWPPGWEGGDNVYTHGPYVPYRWHHLVAQVNGDRIQIYQDGEPAELPSATPDDADVPCHLIVGRLTAMAGTGLSVDRPFVGRLDEFALYDRPLELEEIRAHHRLGAGLARPRGSGPSVAGEISRDFREISANPAN